MEKQELTVFQKLSALKISTGVGENAPYSDHEFVRILQEGERENNLDKIYTFVEACERGCGYRSAYELFPMLKEAYEQSPKELFEIIAGKRHVEKCILLSLCERDMLCKAIELGCEKNTEMLYEALRQLAKYNSDWTAKEEETFISGIVLLSTENEALWIRWIKKEEYKRYWMRILGKVLPRLCTQAMLVFANTIRIDMDVQYQQDIYESLCVMSEEEEEYVLRGIGEAATNRWEDYLEGMRQSKKYHNGLFFSAYGALIYSAMVHNMENEQMWICEVNKCIDRLYDGLEDWYTSKSQRDTVYYVDMTRLSALLQVGKALEFCAGEDLEDRLSKLEKEPIAFHSKLCYAKQ